MFCFLTYLHREPPTRNCCYVRVGKLQVLISMPRAVETGTLAFLLLLSWHFSIKNRCETETIQTDSKRNEPNFHLKRTEIIVLLLQSC